MKKTLTVLALALIVLISSSSALLLHKNGEIGKTGSPGEQTCAGGGCHSGGSSPSFGITISSAPAFTLNQFVPGTVYSMSVTVAATNFNNFGFDCEILNSLNVNAGTMQVPGPGVQFGNFIGRKNATHTTPKVGVNNEATFTFEWTAPTADTSATIYVCGNAVNLNNSTSGDKPIPSSLHLIAYMEVDTTSGVGIRETKNISNTKISVAPNPAKDLVQVSFQSKQNESVEILLCDLNGKVVKQLFKEEITEGNFSKFFDIRTVPNGVYFLKVNPGSQKSAQKLLVID